MNILYTSEAVAEGGRAGHGQTAHGRLACALSIPKELEGEGWPMAIPRPLLCEMTSTLVPLEAW
jgi:organic hydroperoxide reductase OsmC/OhrA